MPPMPSVPQIHDPPARSQTFLHWAGLAVLAANKIRRTVRPYNRPRPWSARDVERSVQYVLDVVRNWDTGFREAGIEDWLRDRDALEIGPGPDLGTGVILLARGARSYTAVDRFPLLGSTPDAFYQALLERLRDEPGAARARAALEAFRSRRLDSAIRYVLLEQPPNDRMAGRAQLFVSQAVLEHVEEPADLLRRLSPWCGPDCLALHHVDAATHTPWIREADPLNILRYAEGLYRRLSFPGSPNRWRASRYVACLRDIGWNVLDVQPVHRLSEQGLERIRPRLDPPFRTLDAEDLSSFSFRLVLQGKRARRSDDPASGSPLGLAL